VTKTKSSSCAAGDLDEDRRCQRRLVYNDAASEEDDQDANSDANAVGEADMQGRLQLKSTLCLIGWGNCFMIVIDW
jgi:hypothetical protein